MPDLLVNIPMKAFGTRTGLFVHLAPYAGKRALCGVTAKGLPFDSSKVIVKDQSDTPKDMKILCRACMTVGLSAKKREADSMAKVKSNAKPN